MIEDVIIDPPKDDQIRIKMVSAGICASDGHFVWGTNKLSEWEGYDGPCVLGHEGAGIVESVGDKVNDIIPDDHVLTTFMPMCKDCSYCASSLTNICIKENIISLAAFHNKRLLSNGQQLKGLAGLGVYSEYVLLKSSQVVKVNICII